jgi:hypothetical protein
MKKTMSVKKRSGEVVKFDADKINKVLAWACEDIPDTSFEEVAMNANLSFFDGISSKDIHNTLIAECGMTLMTLNMTWHLENHKRFIGIHQYSQITTWFKCGGHQPYQN